MGKPPAITQKGHSYLGQHLRIEEKQKRERKKKQRMALPQFPEPDSNSQELAKYESPP